MDVDASAVGDNGGLMAASTSPSRTPVVLTLLAAGVIGFLVGALVAVTGDDVSPEASSTGSPTATPTPASPPGAPAATATPTGTPAIDAELTLTADRSAAGTEELIRLTGELEPPEGAVLLQVQQSVDEMGFLDFPVTSTTLPDGSYGLWVKTRRVGTSEFRMVAFLEGAKVVSNPVTVEIS